MKKLAVEIWSDIACPWCYVGKRRFEKALATFEHRDDVDITWRSFELDPEAPIDRGMTHAKLLAGKYGMSEAQAEAKLQEMTKTGAEAGVEFHFERSRGGNTFDGHRLIHFATERGRGNEMKERLMRAYFSDGDVVGDHETLIKVATELGYDGNEVRTMLESDQYKNAVREDEGEAQAIGITGVPCFVIDRKFGVSGAQPPEQLKALLDKAWAAL
jgi:predicted DsbA family dithiol-disulfide isomerase